MTNICRVRESYDIGLTLSTDPAVVVIDDVLSDDEMDYIKKAAEDKLKPASVLSENGSALVTNVRLANHCWLEYQSDETINAIGQKVSDIVGLPLENAEALQVVHYGIGGKYDAHLDAFDLGTGRGQKACIHGGQRIVTALIYMNSVEEGGETEFPAIGAKVIPLKGRMVIFNNTSRSIMKGHPKSIHAALPVEKGEKWIANMWFRMSSRTENFSPPYSNWPSLNFY